MSKNSVDIETDVKMRQYGDKMNDEKLRDPAPENTGIEGVPATVNESETKLGNILTGIGNSLGTLGTQAGQHWAKSSPDQRAMLAAGAGAVGGAGLSALTQKKEDSAARPLLNAALGAGAAGLGYHYAPQLKDLFQKHVGGAPTAAPTPAPTPAPSTSAPKTPSAPKPSTTSMDTRQAVGRAKTDAHNKAVVKQQGGRGRGQVYMDPKALPKTKKAPKAKKPGRGGRTGKRSLRKNLRKLGEMLELHNLVVSDATRKDTNK